MKPVLVTGATGLIGSNVCRLLRERGTPVRGLVRPGSEVGPLAALGVELAEGDITVREDVRRAAQGASAIVNCAALLGGAGQDNAASQATNYDGSVYCYDAGEEARVIELATTTFFQHDTALTERSPLLDEVNDDPYTTSKSAAYREAARRAAAGQDIVFVIPGGTFGPAPTPTRALAATSYNRAVRAAIRGKIREYLSYPVPWVRAEDVARCVVSAIDAGRSGDTYLAFGQEDALPTADMLNLACESAGVPHRVRDLQVSADDPDAIQKYGETVVALAVRRWPTPWFDNSYTRATLDYHPVPLREAMTETVAWLRGLGQVS